MRAAAAHAVLFLLLVGVALAGREALAAAGLAGAGQFFGIAGSLLILASFAYSLRKRGLLRRGPTARYLRYHELLAWAGAALVLVHGGARLHPLLPWLAQAALVVVVASGLTGRYLLRRARLGLAARRQALECEGLARDEVEERLYWEAVVVDAMARWRSVHIPITLVFGLFAVAHIVSALLFWRW